MYYTLKIYVAYSVRFDFLCFNIIKYVYLFLRKSLTCLVINPFISLLLKHYATIA